MANHACLVVFLGIMFVISAILVACSFAVLTPLEAGIRDNTISKAIQTSRVYTAGRWHVGLGNSFLKFPLTYQTIRFSNVVGSDGAALSVNSALATIECTFHYTLNTSMLIQTYRSFSKSYHTRYVKIAKDIIQSATDSTRFNSSQFYTSRRLISSTLLTALTSGLRGSGAIVHDFQLNRVFLPATTQNSIVTNIVQRQTGESTTLNGTIRLIQAESAVIQGEQQQLIQFFIANTTRDASVITQSAAANVTAILLTADSMALNSLKTTIGFSNAEMLQYVWLRNLRINSGEASLSAVLGYSG